MIAITGIGAICSLGVGRGLLMEALRSGRGALGGGPTAAVERFNAKDFIPAMRARRLSRCTQLAVCSAVEAVRDSGLPIGGMDPFRVGVSCGTGLASTGSTDAFFEGILRQGPEGMNPMLFPETVPNASASQIAIEFGVKGPNNTFSHNEISAELALDFAMGLLMDGRTDAVIVGAAEELCPAAAEGFGALGLLSRTGKMSPFGPGADGLVLSEGGAALVLERAPDAARRGASIHALISPVGFSCAPVGAMSVEPGGRALATAMRAAMSGAPTVQIGMVSASARSALAVDEAEAEAEAMAIWEVFPGGVPVSALRGYTGFYLSDGLLRLAASALCMREGLVPGLPGGVETEFGRLDLGRRSGPSIGAALVNSMAAGGAAASVLLRLPD